MKRRITVIALVILCVAFIILPCSTANASESERLPRFIDEVGLLTSEEAAILTDKLDEISLRHEFDTVIAVVRALDYREARLFAVDFFEDNGFGFGANLDGAILLLATQDRDFGFASLGFGREVFTPAGQEYLDKLFLPYLKNDQYYEAFVTYAEAIDEFLTKAEAGRPYDKRNIPLTPSERADYRKIAIIVSLCLPLLVALIVTFIWKRQLVSVRKQDYAHAYIRDGSMVMTASSDIFLYRNVQMVARPKNNDNSSHSGGSSFTSSSGSSATGHSGKY